MNIRILWCGALLGVLATASPGTVDAQLGGALKAARGKVRDQVVQPAGGAARTADSGTPAAPSSSSSSGASNAVVEINLGVLDRLERALAAEAAERAEVARALAALPTPEQYASCQFDVMQSPASESLTELTSARCGEDPSQQAELRREMASRPEAAGARAGNFTIDNGRHFGTVMVSREYAILKERVLPFCLSRDTAAGGARIKGEGKAYYVYTGAEVEALRTRCAALSPALQTVL